MQTIAIDLGAAGLASGARWRARGASVRHLRWAVAYAESFPSLYCMILFVYSLPTSRFKYEATL
jgi:hypothetical protein